MSYIQFKGITKQFGDVQALKGIDLEVKKGELVTLLGPSGCGKSTLLRCLAGLEEVTSGQIFLDGKEITHLTPKQRQIGMVFQQYSLFPNLTVSQNVGFGLQIKKLPKKEISEKVQRMLDTVGLAEKISQYPNQLSGGQQQRVALARALVMEPKVLLLDEPLSAIDALMRRNLQTEIRRIQRTLDITTIFVTHDQDEAMVMSDTIHLFNMGKLEQSGHPVDLYTRPGSRFAASFIGHYNLFSADAFGTLTGRPATGPEIAVRPEIIELSAAPFPAEEGSYQLSGVVAGSVPHGNIIRYTVQVEGVPITADILFDTNMIFNEGEPIHLKIPELHCLPL